MKDLTKTGSSEVSEWGPGSLVVAMASTNRIVEVQSSPFISPDTFMLSVRVSLPGSPEKHVVVPTAYLRNASPLELLAYQGADTDPGGDVVAS